MPVSLPSQLHGRFPILPRSYVPRDRLWQRLDAAAVGPATLVVAPAGSGKTLGVAGWLHARGRADSAVWVTATPELDAARLRALLAELRARPQALLVVDDAHRLPPDAMTHLDQQLGDDPESLSVVLLSRWDLPLTRLVPELLGHLTVLRGGVLRLDDDEVAALVQAHARTSADDVVGPIRHLAQGWCAVVVLAAKAVGADRDPAAAARRLMNGSSSVADRIMGEVFAAMTSRQRHLLLCAVAEPRVTGRLARHLSRDANAEQTLDELESTGLLVTRHEPSDHAGAMALESAYDIHPLLREVVQRRIRLGGVDVERARASVRRAVRADVAQGDIADAFRRLDAMDAAVEVADLLARHGTDLVLGGHLAGLRDFVRRHAHAVDLRPACWLSIALERWQAGDLAGARIWLERVVASARATDEAAAGGDGTHPLAPASAALMLARLDVGDPWEAVRRAEDDLAEQGRAELAGGPLTELVRYQLGVVAMRLGDLREAERQLGSVVTHCRASGPPQLAVAATAQLAVAQLLLGREHAALELAESAARELRSPAMRVGMSRARRTADIVRGIAVIQRVLEPGRAVASDEDLEEQPEFDGSDPVVATLHRVLRARSYLLRGAVARAEQALTGGAVSHVPAPLVSLVAFEESLQAVLSSDWNRLQRLEELLSEHGADAEATLVAGLRADGIDDTRAAADLYAAAVSRARSHQPPTAAMALTCRAQLLAADGRDSDAMEHLAAAVTATQGRRNALPFLGWSRHGTPVATLFQRLADRLNSEWSRQLATGTAANPGGLAAAAAPLTATPRERAHVPDGVMRPSLSPRERDVLHELARGSTYADIAANLYVSENTVKTHVSSLYAKLAVSRRSDALAVARTLRLL